jgi:predicted RecB family nuclease
VGRVAVAAVAHGRKHSRPPGLPPSGAEGLPAPPITEEVFSAYLKCRYKAYLKLAGAAGEKSDYGSLQERLTADYRSAARMELVRRHAGGAVTEAPASLLEAVRGGADLITDAVASDGGEACRLDALERIDSKQAGAYRPVLFSPREKVTADDRRLLAFRASVLVRVLGKLPETGKIVHGNGFRASRVELATLLENAGETVAEIKALQGTAKPPPLVLNRHCPECEFRKQCHAAAIEKDDLSLLRGLTPKEIEGLNGRGIFSVTQLSYTFRPGRMKRTPEKAGKKHDHSLQALAIREKTVYVARRPQLPDAVVRLYLDVEGLPDDDFYCLVGLTAAEGDSRRHRSFWAESRADEASVWAAFLAASLPARFQRSGSGSRSDTGQPMMPSNRPSAMATWSTPTRPGYR